MLQILETGETADVVSSFREQYLKAFRIMLLSRVLDDKLASLYRSGKIHGGVFLGRGQEALSVSLGLALRKGDVFAPLIRDGAGRIAIGEPVVDSVRTHLGSAQGPMRGRDGNIHRGRPRDGYFAMISHLGAMISVVNGALLAKRFKKIEGVVGATCIGDGGTSTGAFHEGLNQAAVEKLPLVLVVANNEFAYSTPTSRQFACRDLADKAIGYGVPVHKVDGTDLEKCLHTLREAVARAREGGGPQMVSANLLRLCGHGEHDDNHYNTLTGRDCLEVAGEHLLRRAWADEATIQQFREEVTQEVEQAVAIAQREPGPDPYKENWCALASRHLSERFETPDASAHS
jgi:pyruvate dehydrogenase E1 component alpha subunit/2-oxoisovalerate dehydrogenase E1 component alpha subunit